MSEAIKAEKPAAKPEVRINGNMYRLRFDLGAIEQIQEEFGGSREAFSQMNGADRIKVIRKLFVILANAQRDYDGMPENVTEDVIGRHTTLAKMNEIAAAVNAAVEIGKHSETYGGEADDEPRDALAEEYDQKNV